MLIIEVSLLFFRQRRLGYIVAPGDEEKADGQEEVEPQQEAERDER